MYHNELNIPLKSMNIKASVLSNTAEVDYSLVYQNDQKDAIQNAIITLPFDNDAAISNVTLYYHNTTFKAEAIEAKKATRVFEEKISQQKTTLMVHKIDDFVRIHLATIPPNTQINVTFSLSMDLPILFDSKKEKHYAHFVLPVTYMERYSAHRPGVSHSSPNVAYGFNFEFTAPQATSIEGTHLTLNRPPTEDISIRVYSDFKKAFISNFDGLTVTKFIIDGNEFTPPSLKPIPSIVFLLDRSGSMSGQSIKHVANALEYFIHSLPANTRFDIVGFGSSYSPLFGSLRELTETTAKLVQDYATTLRADMGGTEILQPLVFISETYHPDNIILLTDGEVTNVDEVRSFACRQKSIISTLGIGAAASVNLLKGLALDTGGTYEFIGKSSDIEPAIVRCLDDVLDASISEFTIDARGCGFQLEAPRKHISRDRMHQLVYISEGNQQCSVTIKTTQDTKLLTTDKALISTSKMAHCVAISRAANRNVINATTTLHYAKHLALMTAYTNLLLYDDSTSHEASIQQEFTIPMPRPEPMHRLMRYGGSKLGGYHAIDVVFPEMALQDEAEEAYAPPIPKNRIVMGHQITNNKRVPDQCLAIVQKQNVNGTWTKGFSIEGEEVKNEMKIDDEDFYTQAALDYLSKSCKNVGKLVIKKGEEALVKKLGQKKRAELQEAFQKFMSNSL